MHCFTFSCRLQWFSCDEHVVDGVVFRLVCDVGIRRPPFAWPFAISLFGVRTIDGAVWCDSVDTFSGWMADRLSIARAAGCVAATITLGRWIWGGGGGGGCFGCKWPM